jgi:hypothetical protein
VTLNGMIFIIVFSEITRFVTTVEKPKRERCEYTFPSFLKPFRLIFSAESLFLNIFMPSYKFSLRNGANG